MDDERALAADACALAVTQPDVVEGGPSEHGQLELRPRVLVRAQHVALPEPRRAAGDLAGVEQLDVGAAHRERSGGRGAHDPGTHHGDLHG
jgi:hypothetical protein